MRRLLALPHDTWDTLADELHTAPISLDELHDPKRLWSLGSEDPAELQAELARLRAELGSYRAALSRPFPVAVLHWPEPELDELLTAYPELQSEYPTHAAHLLDIEASLRELAAAGTAEPGHRDGHDPLVRGLRRLGVLLPGQRRPPPAVRHDPGRPRPRSGLAAGQGGGLLVRVGGQLWGLPRRGLILPGYAGLSVAPASLGVTVHGRGTA